MEDQPALAGDGLGPEWYRRLSVHRVADAEALIEHALGRSPLIVRKDTAGSSHAVYFVTLADGGEVVLRVAMQPDQDEALERWMIGRCRAAGVPVPDVLVCRPSAGDGVPAFVITRRLPGRPAHKVRLSPQDRGAVLREMGGYLAAIHSIPVPGFGRLVRRGRTYAGGDGSLWNFVQREFDADLERLPHGVLPPPRRRALLARLTAARNVLKRPRGALLHGDYRLKNAVLVQTSPGWRVSGLVDFEMAAAGDPAQDLAYFFYSLRSDAWSEADVSTICAGYGCPYPLTEELRRRVLLYQVWHAVGHLFWEVSFRDEAGIARVLAWLDELEAALDVLT